MHRFLKSVLDAIFPPHKDVAASGAITEEQILALVSPKEGAHPWIHSLLPYSDPRVRALIRSIKYYNDRHLLPVVGKMGATYIEEEVADLVTLSGWHTIILTPIPGAPNRLRERGYNQAERIAEAIAKEIDVSIQYVPGVLGRHNRESQVRVHKNKREENISGAFFVLKPDVVHGTCIILIDDVTESGGTLADARRALMEAGATDVLGIALAH